MYGAVKIAGIYNLIGVCFFGRCIYKGFFVCLYWYINT